MYNDLARDVNDLFRLRPISRYNERSMLKYLKRLTGLMQSSYNTTLDEDERSFEQGDYQDYNEKNILKIRIEERIALKNIKLFCEDIIDILGTYYERTVEVCIKLIQIFALF